MKSKKDSSLSKQNKSATSVTIGSRGSDLALWQTNFIKEKLEKLNVNVDIKIIKTQGDKIQNLSFDKLEGKGFFTKELEEALLNNEIDLAVHSHKDLPTENPKGLCIAAVSYREDPSELLLINKDAVDEKEKFSLKKGLLVGTSSARRKSQLLAFRPDIKIQDLRGNVPTRIQKLKNKHYDAIMLAAAGLERLAIDTSEFYTLKLDPKEFISAPAQGVLALQTRDNNSQLIELLGKLNDAEVQQIIAVERKILNLFDGGCQLPLGAYCETAENESGETIYRVWASMAEKWDAPLKSVYMQSKYPQTLPEKVVQKIKDIKPFSVYISRNKKPNDVFVNNLTQLGFEVYAQSMIEIKKIPLKKTEFPKAEWIFFASKNAVKYFFDQHPVLQNVKYGAVGKGTSEELRKYGKRPDFIGQSTDTRMIGKQFAALVGRKIVLFPQAKGSIKTIQQQLNNKEQVIDLQVYETIKNNIDVVPPCDVLVFTSPSNVESYLEKKRIEPNQKIIAMGDATANALKEKNIKPNAMPPDFTDTALMQAVLSL